MKTTETTNERYTRYFRQNKETFFASNNDMYEWAQNQSFLKPVWEIPGLEKMGEKDNFGPKSTWFYLFVKKEDDCPEDILRYFKDEVLNLFGDHIHNLNYEI